MATDPGRALRDGMRVAQHDVQQLWIAMFGLGGDLTTTALEDIVAGSRPPTSREYGLLQVAIDEHLGDLGLAPSVVSWIQPPDPLT